MTPSNKRPRQREYFAKICCILEELILAPVIFRWLQDMMGGSHGRILWEDLSGGSHGRILWADLMGGSYGRILLGGSYGRISWKDFMGGSYGRILWADLMGGSYGRISWEDLSGGFHGRISEGCYVYGYYVCLHFETIIAKGGGRCFGSYFDVIFLMYLVSSGFSIKPTSSSSSSSSTQFSQEWVCRKVVVKHSIK